MLETLRGALKTKDIRKKLLYTFMMLIVICFGSELPIPGVNTSYFVDSFAKQTGGTLEFFNAMTRGSFISMSISVLSITPYITSPIIMQLMTTATPKLEEIQKEGGDGRKEIAEYTRYVTTGPTLIQSIVMAVDSGGQGPLKEFSAVSVIVVVSAMIAGSVLLMWIGGEITENGAGNGISIVPLFNTISSIPEDSVALYSRFLPGKSIGPAVVMVVIIIAITAVMVVSAITLQDVEGRIPIQYSRKVQGRGMVDGQSSNIPLKMNTVGVIPVIFTPSIMFFPVVIAQFFQIDYTTFGGKTLLMLSSSSWSRPKQPIYSIGIVIYLVLIIVFAYFYTSITSDPLKMVNNMKKRGGLIPGIRSGKPTSDYPNSILNYIVFIGACGLIIVGIVPIAISGSPTVSRLSFAGTSLIIIVGVIPEIMETIESQMPMRNCKGFPND